MPRAHLAVLTAAALTFALGACGGEKEKAVPATAAVLPKTTRALSVAGLGRAQRIEGFGHSYIGAYGVKPQRGFFRLVAKRFRLTGGQTGGGGSTVLDQLDDVYANNLQRRSGPRAQLGIVMWGINDVALYGPAVYPAFENGLSSLLSRMRVAPGDAHPWSDATVKLGPGWNGAGSVASTTSNATLDIALARRDGGRTLGFVAPASQGTGALYRFTIDGQAAGSLDTRGLFPSTPKSPAGGPTPFIKRLRLPAGARTLHVAVSGVRGRAQFYGWHREAAHPPLIVVVHQPRLPGYIAYNGAFHQPDDDDITALNAATDRAIAGFTDRRVVHADADAEMHKDTVFFLDDRLHPDDLGHRWLAKVAIDAFDAAARRARTARR
jgi:hypothetical protein